MFGLCRESGKEEEEEGVINQGSEIGKTEKKGNKGQEREGVNTHKTYQRVPVPPGPERITGVSLRGLPQ